MLHEVLVGLAVLLLLLAGVIQLSWCRCPRRPFYSWHVDDRDRPDSLPRPDNYVWLVAGTGATCCLALSYLEPIGLRTIVYAGLAVAFGAIMFTSNIVAVTNARGWEVEGPGYVVSYFRAKYIKEGEKVHLKPWQFFVSSFKVFHGNIREMDGNILNYKLVLVGIGPYHRNLRDRLKDIHLGWMHGARELAETMPTNDWSAKALSLVSPDVIIRDLELER